MTQQKSIKRRVRARMAKTGERYTAARLHVVSRNGHEPESPASEPSTSASTAEYAMATGAVPEVAPQDAPALDAAAREAAATEPAAPPATPALDGPAPGSAPESPFRAGAGASDAALIRRTGNTWEHWFRILDRWGGADRPHGEIARYLNGEHGVDGWWAQELTVRYEMAIGRRVPGQRPDGFEVTASKTVGVPVERLLDAWIEDDQRKAWLSAPLRLRSVNRGRTLTARFDWTDPSQRIVVWCNPKGDRSTVALAHQKIGDAEAAAELKAFWKDAVASLARFLADNP